MLCLLGEKVIRVGEVSGKASGKNKDASGYSCQDAKSPVKGVITAGRVPRRSRILQPAALQGVAHDLGPAVQVEFFHRPCLVRLHGLDAQGELARNLLITVAGGDEP